MNTYTIYQIIIKPAWAPPAWLFGPVWTVLYIIIAVSFLTVFYNVWKGKLKFSVSIPFILNLIFNLSFTYFQFGLQNNLLAAIDILLVLATLIWSIILIYPKMKWVAISNTPYLLWVTFATVLQLTITYLNW